MTNRESLVRAHEVEVAAILPFDEENHRFARRQIVGINQMPATDVTLFEQTPQSLPGDITPHAAEHFDCNSLFDDVHAYIRGAAARFRCHRVHCAKLAFRGNSLHRTAKRVCDHNSSATNLSSGCFLDRVHLEYSVRPSLLIPLGSPSAMNIEAHRLVDKRCPGDKVNWVPRSIACCNPSPGTLLCGSTATT